jgi:hypothetical protein
MPHSASTHDGGTHAGHPALSDHSGSADMTATTVAACPECGEEHEPPPAICTTIFTPGGSAEVWLFLHGADSWIELGVGEDGASIELAPSLARTLAAGLLAAAEGLERERSAPSTTPMRAAEPPRGMVQ